VLPIDASLLTIFVSLVTPETLEMLVHMVIDKPSEDVDEKARYR
jgi:hypothetical protein